MDLVPMVIREVGTDPVGRPMVILADEHNRRFLPIWIGHWEAWSIAVKLQGREMERPLTHDLLTDVLSRLGVSLERVVVSEVRETTYFAIMTLRENGHVREIDARPSDALALALRTGADVFVADEVLQQAALEPQGPVESDQRMDTFKKLIDDVENTKKPIDDSEDTDTEGP